MNRKLHNTVMALIASTSLFVLGLLSSHPALPQLSDAEIAAAAFDAETAVASEAEADQAESPAPRRQARRGGRHASVAMPFFSFAPRG